jgi:hypothetical protein
MLFYEKSARKAFAFKAGMSTKKKRFAGMELKFV